MQNIHLYKVVIFPILALLLQGCGNSSSTKDSLLEQRTAEENEKSLVFWHWIHGAISKEGITADLEAMKSAGLGGAYIFSIRGVTEPPLFDPSVETLSPEWWGMIKHAMSEADRLGLELGMNGTDGFTCAGGPWITPEMSMQKVVWADTVVDGSQIFNDKLPQPEMYEDYYEDIATFAYPAVDGAGMSSYNLQPVVTTSLKGKDLQFLAGKDNDKQFSTDEPCWIQFAFDEPFTCRSVVINTGWNNYQSNRLIIETSNDGTLFKRHTRLVPPRAGWLDLDADATQTIEPVTARYFRFVYDPKGSEPGAEDLDDAKWSPTLRIKGLELSGEAKIHQFEGKNGSIWRISSKTDDRLLPASACVPKDQLINISESLQADGRLNWSVPDGKWVILRMGHTSTGHENYVGGAGKGLECDKFNPEVVRLHFDHWFGEAFRQIGAELAPKVLKNFLIDSWECGSQNWSPVFQDEFKKRRGYDITTYLPLMAGVAIQNSGFSERVLADVRKTVAELFNDNFYKVLVDEVHAKGCLFAAESVAPVGVTDGMLHFKDVDIPMGEFWFRSPSHDKPNDILDAVSGAHVYGKKIIQAESFTEIRLDWDEHPGMLKTTVDRNFADGINRIVPHVYAHNPWLDRKPGMTLDKIGTYFQRDQTWWKPGRAFFTYLTNCQRQLQKGNPVVDIAVFTGEEVPRRALLPDRLVDILPGIMGEERVKTEQIRLANEGAPTWVRPQGVTTQENMANPEEWVDPLNGYAYDSFNKDALVRLAKVEDGRIVLPGGANYGMLIIPGNRKIAPHGGEQMSVEVAQRLLQLAEDGATILMMDKPTRTIGMTSELSNDEELKTIVEELFRGDRKMISDVDGRQFEMWKKGKGRILQGPYRASSFDLVGIEKDFQSIDQESNAAKMMAWNHRNEGDEDIYFIANQLDEERVLELSFRIQSKIPKIYNPVTGDTIDVNNWENENGRTKLTYKFSPNESLFVVFKEGTSSESTVGENNWIEQETIETIDGVWQVNFDPAFGGPKKTVAFSRLTDWSKNQDVRIRYYSGTATYSKVFQFGGSIDENSSYWIELGDFANIAEVKLNGQNVGVSWTPPFRLQIDGALKQGENILQIEVTNTWANRLIGDHDLPEEERVSWTTAPYRLEGRPLLPAGLFGPVKISQSK
ncbi:glycosyl hydrolase [Sunxiuqinia indica]|uniref:glycosyl hydrolase n=1 Tax=Sunxiuqinia indica TaxID=2692584 RepID=UPI00135C57F8|nr:glycosyl hydrolase [Sunxiuqinia indica]